MSKPRVPAEPTAEPTTGQRSRARHRHITVALSVASGLLLVLGAAVAYDWSRSGDEPVIYQVDQQVVQDWNRKLAPALADLNSLSDVEGLKAAGPARVRLCSVDSGELFDLSAGRAWVAVEPGRTVENPPATVTPGTAHAFLEVVRRLRIAGWHVVGTRDNLDMELPPDLTYDTADLTRTAAGVRNHLSLQVFDDGLNADLGFDGAQKACGGD